MTTAPLAPRLAAAVLLEDAGRVLLVQRARDPGRGEWALPGGKVGPGETVRAAAERETLEECGLVVRAGELIWWFETIERDADGALLFHYVVLDFSAEWQGGTLRAGDDAADARWFSKAELAELNLNRYTRKFFGERGWINL